MRVEQAARDAAAPIGANVAGAWDQLRSDWQASHPDLSNYPSGFWDQMKAQWDRHLAVGKLPLDAFNLAMAPVSGAIDAGISKPLGWVLDKLTPPGTPAGEGEKAVNQALLALGPKGGLGAALGKTAEAGAGAEDLATQFGQEGGAPKAAPASPSTASGSTLLTGPVGDGAPPAAALTAPAAAPKPAPYQLIGKDGPTVNVTPEIRQNATDWLNGVTGDNPVQASLGQIADPKVMDEAIQGVASFLPKDEVRPDEIVRQAAYSIAKQPEDIVQGGLTGKLPSDTEIAAHAMLINSGAQQLGDLAQKAIASGDPADWEAATRAFALQTKIVGDWQEAGAEQARAFRMRQIAQEARSDYTSSVSSVIQNVGSENVEDALRKIASLKTPQQISGFTAALRGLSSRHAMLYVWYNYLLGPATFAKKIGTDALFPIWNLATRYTAEKAGELGLNQGGVPAGESAQLLYGYLGSFADAIRAGYRGLMAGRSQYGEISTMDGLAKTRTSILANGGEIAQDASGTGLVHSMRNALPLIRAAMPTSWMAGADDFGYTLNYRAELRALAWREGMGKFMTASGDTDAAAVAQHVAEQLENPKPGLFSAADAAAKSNIFADPLTGNAEKFSDWINGVNLPIKGTRAEIPLGKILVPFVNRPVNFLRWLYRQSPLPLAFPSDAFKAELAAGGASRDLAYAKIGLGTGLGAIAAVLAVGGLYDGSGPTDPRLRQAWLAAGHVPYSLRIRGARPVTMPLEPFARILGAVGDAVDVMRFAKDEDIANLAGSIIFGLGHAFVSTTYMQSLGNFFEAIHNQGEANRYVQQLIASMAVPRTLSASAGAVDPWLRAHYSLLQAIEAKLPFSVGFGKSTDLPPARDRWGDAIPLRDHFMPPFSDSGAAQVFSPIELGPDPSKVNSIDQWIWDHRNDFAGGNPGIPKPSRTQSWQQGQGVKANVQLTPQQYDRLQVLAGNGFKDPRSGLGAKDTLNALVQGKGPAFLQKEWDAASDAHRALIVQQVVSIFRRGARQQLLHEFPDIQQAVTAQWGARRDQLNGATPSLPGGATPPAPASLPAAPRAGGASAMPRLE